VSEHTGKHGGNGFDQLWNVVASEDRYVQEKEYNPDLTSATSLKTVQWGAVWSLGYTFSPPISPRTATFLTTTHLETVTPRIGWVISIPFDIGNDDLPLSLFVEAGVKSSTVCVERFRELEGGKVEWLAASSTCPGGSIPSWLWEYLTVKRIISIVPRVDRWLEEHTKAVDTSGPSSSSHYRTSSMNPISGTGTSS